MSARTVQLAGGAPWGFRMHGGADLNQPLRISRVNPGRKASLSGIREGDVITSINGRPTRGVSNAEAHAMLRSAGPTLTLGLNEDREVSPRRRGKGAELKRPSQLSTDMIVGEATPQAPVYATIRQPGFSRQNSAPVRSSLNTLPTGLHSTPLYQSVSTSEEPVKIYPTNPFYTSLQGYSTTSRLPVPNGRAYPSLDRSRSLNSSRDCDDFPSHYEDGYNKSSSYLTKGDNVGSTANLYPATTYEPETNGLDPKTFNAHANNSKCDIFSSTNEKSTFTNGLPKGNENLNSDPYIDPFDTSKFSNDTFEKYFRSSENSVPNSTSDSRFNTKEEITKSSKITEHKISEIQEVKTMKKIILNGSGDTISSEVPKPVNYNTFENGAYHKSGIDGIDAHVSERKIEGNDTYFSRQGNAESQNRSPDFSWRMTDQQASTTNAPAPQQPKVPPPQIVTSPPSTSPSPAPQQQKLPPVWRPGAPSPPPPAPGRSPSAGAPPPPPPPPPVWTPRSAGPSPQTGRKNFRPVHFEDSPPVRRKFDSEPNGCVSDGEGRMRTSQSAPASGLNSLGGAPRLPRAQHPTVTLLQKAREGQLPRGASYLPPEDSARLPRDRASPPRGHPVHALRREYASEGEAERSDHERRNMADEPRKLEGIGPTTKEGMPVALRSEVKDQSRWYKKMYDTIHKNKYDNDYVTVRYKSPQGNSQTSSRPSSNRSQYAYFDPRSGYLSEPEGPVRGAGERRRTASVQEDRREELEPTSPYLPSNKYSTLASARASQEVYKNQPGRIEDYVPGKSSVVDKEAKQWWDEVMDIFDGWLDENSPLPPYATLLARAIQKSQLSSTTSLPQASPKEKKDLTSTILSTSNMARALKESGYESDSTLVFRRRGGPVSPLSPAERRAAYSQLQAGGEPPLAGFRSPAPQHHDDSEIEYIPISPTLTKIRVHKKSPQIHEVICYPVTSIETDFQRKFRKQAPSFFNLEVPNKVGTDPPAPPRRISSKASRTLNLVTHNRPPSVSPKRKEISKSLSNVDFLKDKISNKLSRQNTQIISKSVPLKTKMAAEKSKKNRVTSSSAPPSIDRKISSSFKSTTNKNFDAKSSASSSYASSRRTLTPTEYTNPIHTKYHSSPSPSVVIEGGAGRRTPISNILDRVTSLDKLWSSEKRNEPLDKAKAKASLTKSNANSTSRLNLSRVNSKSLTKPLSPRSSNRGRDMLRTAEKIQKLRSANHTKSTPCIVSSVSKLSNKVGSSERLSPHAKSTSHGIVNAKKQSLIKTAVVTDLRKKKPEVIVRSKSNSSSNHRSSLRKAKDASKKESKKTSKSKSSKKNSSSSNESDNSSQFGVESGKNNNTTYKRKALSAREIKATRDAVVSDSFFQHLFLGGSTSTIREHPSMEYDSSVLQKAKMFQTYPQEYISSKTVNSYLVHRKPVSQSRFKMWDRYASPVRSPSPRSVSWPGRINQEVRRFDSLLKCNEFGSTSSLCTVRSRSEPPENRLYFSQTTRPKSPTVIFHKKEKPKSKSKSPPKIIFSQTSGPVSPKIYHKTVPVKVVRNQSVSPTRIVFSQTVRPISPAVKSRHKVSESLIQQPVNEKTYPTLYFSETSRPVSPRVMKKSTDSISRSNSASPVRDLRSPSYRRISNVRNAKNNGVLRTRSAGDADKKIIKNNQPVKTQSQLNLSSCDPEYDEYLEDLQNDSIRSERFRELNRYYTYLERVGELEKATSSCDLRHRKKDEEIIDFDRWKKIRAIERAEEELNNLYDKLKQAQSEKDFLFYPRDVKDFRWSHGKDRGLRIKEKSVEDLKDQFQHPYYESCIDFELPSLKDHYKPLWRGTSVAETAFNINRKNETQTIKEKKRTSFVNLSQDTTLNELRKKIGLGNHLWSSLSIDQVNALKNQLNAIYSKELETKSTKDADKFTVDVKDNKYITPQLHVRSNSLISTPSSPETVKELSKSESIAAISCPITSVKELKNNVNKIQMTLSENEKRKISQNLSKEVMDRVKKFENPSPVPLQQELEAATGTEFTTNNHRDIMALGAQTCQEPQSGLENNNRHVVYPKEKTDIPQPSSASETETGSSDISGRTVIYRGPKKEVQKKVEYFESVKNSAEPKVIYHAREDSDEKQNQNIRISLVDDSVSSKIKDCSTNIMQSQSCTNIKELFGESEKNKFLSLPPKSVQYSRSPSPQWSHASSRRSPGPEARSSSAESVVRSRSVSPSRGQWRAWLTLARPGEVRRLARRFDSPATLRRHRSDPELNYNMLRAWPSNEPLISKRPTKRNPLPVARVPLRAGNRFMPHIDIISKLAALRRRTAPRSKSAEETPECRPGEVERIRRRFEVMSLLGQIYVSAPDMTELHDMAPYLSGSWIAHRYPKQSDNNKSIQDPSKLVFGRTSPVRKEPPKPKAKKGSVKLSSILKTEPESKEFDPSIHRPAKRYEPPRAPPRPPPASWPQRLAPYITQTRHSVTFQESDSAPQPPRRAPNGSLSDTESPRRYVESDVNIHYKCPVRRDPLPLVPERELARQQAEHMKRLYREQKRTKYLQELQDMQNRRHQDNFTPSQKNILPLNRYDEASKTVARALYAFNGQTPRELSFRKGDYITVRRQIDANWYEGELHGRIGLFPYNYAEILKGEAVPTLKRPSLIEGRARAKFDFTAQTNLELPLKKGEVVVLTRRIDHNWWEGRNGNKTGIFPDSYVQVLQEPTQSKPELSAESNLSKGASSPAAHGQVGASARRSMGAHSYTPQLNSAALAPPAREQPLPGFTVKPPPSSQTPSERGYGPLTTPGLDLNNTEPLYVDTNAEAVPYRAMYKYRPQNPDELELREGDTVYVLEKCDDGWYVGSSQRTGRFGTFPGNYVERI